MATGRGGCPMAAAAMARQTEPRTAILDPTDQRRLRVPLPDFAENISGAHGVRIVLDVQKMRMFSAEMCGYDPLPAADKILDRRARLRREFRLNMDHHV
jgi:hypothetical protein